VFPINGYDSIVVNLGIWFPKAQPYL
jgi:hypothetical protein